MPVVVQVSTTTGVFKSQSRRWARCVNTVTWPEVQFCAVSPTLQHLAPHLQLLHHNGAQRSWHQAVLCDVQVLRRYLLFSRALVAVPLAAVQGLQPHQLDDQAVAVFAAKALSQQPWHRCAGRRNHQQASFLTASASRRHLRATSCQPVHKPMQAV
jgi:hypothetical protein